MKTLSLIFLAMLLPTIVICQHANTMFYMDRLPQSNQLNPAMHPTCRFWIGGLVIPLVGQAPPPLHFDVSVPFGYNDVIMQGKGEYHDLKVTPIHPTQDPQDFLDKLGDVNYVKNTMQLSLLTVGFKNQNNFWTIEANNRFSSSVGFPRSFLELAVYGNGENPEIDLTGFSIDMNAYNEFALGFSQKADPTSTYAIKMKYINGLANVTTINNEIKLLTDTAEIDNITADANFVLNVNFPLDVKLAGDNKSIDEIYTPDNLSEIDYLLENFLFTNNHGAAVDLGFKKDLTPEFSLYGSLIDFGFISWKSSPQTMKLSGDFEFKGVQVQSVSLDSLDKIIDVDTLVSQLKDSYNFDYKKEEYISSLPYKIYVGAQYKFTRFFNVGGLWRAEKANIGFNHSFTGSANFRPFRYGALTFSLSYINKSIKNFGAGFTLRVGAVQTYFVFDNYSLIFGDEDARFVSFRMGTNLIFGRGKKKQEKDRPLMYTL